MALRTHVLAGAALDGTTESSEQSLTPALLQQVPNNSLTVLGRNLLSLLSLLPLQSEGASRRLLARTKSNTAMKSLEKPAEGDELVELKVSHEAQTQDPTLGALVNHHPFRNLEHAAGIALV